MALKSEFLAAEPPALRRSRALHRFTVASPLVLMLAVGTVGHVGKVRYARPTSAAGYERKVRAYVPRVARVQALQQEETPSRKALEEETGRWLAGYRSGELQTLKPAFFEDHFQGGPRGEVARAAFGLSDMLVFDAARDLEAGHPQRAADAALRAAKVGRGMQEFEPQALLQSLLNQRRTLFVIGRAWPRLSPEAKAKLRPELQALKVDPAVAERLMAEADARYEEYRVRQRVEDSTPEGIGDKQESGALARSIRVSNGRIDALLR